MKTLAFIVSLICAFQCNAQLSDFSPIHFQKADSIALVHKNETLHNLPELAYKLTSNLPTDVERFRAIYKWVCGNIANDYKLYFKNKRKRHRFKNDSLKLQAWNEQFKKILFKKLTEDKRTICTGYAYLIKELSKLANIKCEIVQGYGRTSMTDVKTLDTPNHSWNAVKLNGRWYLCDATWASGIPNPKTNIFEFQYNDGFFLANPKLFAVNHHPVEDKWLLLDEDKTSFQTFLDAPILYGKAYEHLNIHNEPKAFHNTIHKNEKIVFNYQLLKPTESKEISLLIDNGTSSKKINPQSVSVQNTSLTIEYKFEHTGFYDVHLYIGSDLISTYTFKVKS